MESLIVPSDLGTASLLCQFYQLCHCEPPLRTYGEESSTSGHVVRSHCKINGQGNFPVGVCGVNHSLAVRCRSKEDPPQCGGGNS